MLPLSETLRIARVLHRVWANRPQPAPDTTRLWRDFDSLAAAARLAERHVRLALRHHLTLTMTRLQDEFSESLGKRARQVERLHVESAIPNAPAPALRTWIEDVRQLDAEFGSVAVRWPDHILRVVTEPIVLDGVELGPFAIEFDWGSCRFDRGIRAFDVIALEPNPATGREEVVHPHVEGTRLCAADAAEPLRQALDEGRLADAFLLVQSVLTTYNPKSPYVPLDHWDGFRCSNCGRRGDSGDSRSCEACDSRLCDECADSCSRCSDTRCPDCLTACAVCDDRFCRGCLVVTPSERLVCTMCRADCQACGTRVAADEIEDGRCGSCPEPDSVEESDPQPLEEAHAA